MSVFSSYKTHALVVYKTQPAKIIRIDSKIEIELADGKKLNVREKDLTLLHEGPVVSLASLVRQTLNTTEIDSAFELVAGETVTLKDFTELVFGKFTPENAWAIYQILNDGLYVTGSVDSIQVRTKEAYQKELNQRVSKENEKRYWESFVKRMREGVILPEDSQYLQTLIDFACNRTSKCRLLKELELSESPEQAHSLLLKLGVWDNMFNPYIARNGFSLEQHYPLLSERLDEERRDLTHLEAFAIDDEGTTDPDDAISIEGNKLWIHVADVASLVEPNCPMDQYARKLAANLYLPDKIVHMLSPKITELLGLGLHEVSPALSLGISLYDGGEINEVEIAITKVKVRRLTYDQAQSSLNLSPLKEINTWIKRYRAYRLSKGATAIQLPEAKIKVIQGKVEIKPLIHYESQDMVADAMILAGEAAARFAIEHHIDLPFVTQASPEKYENPSDLASMYAYRRLLRPSEIKLTPDSHNGLGLAHYSRVTSPLRRYLDLITHQQLRAFILKKVMLSKNELMNRVGISAATIGAITNCERQSNRHFTLVYLLQNPQWQGRAIVVEIRERYFIVVIPVLGFEARISAPIKVSLNEELEIKVNGVDLAEGIAHFRLV